MRTATAALVLVLVMAVGPLAAQADPDKTVSGGGTLPSGWNVRTDLNMRTGQAPGVENVKFVAMGNGYHATMGPAAIFWRDGDTISANYHVVASIAQTKNPEHPEAYGLFIGGRHLADSSQSYTYFIIRAVDGKYMIRRRPGYAARPTNVVDWTASDAVTKADSTGKATNELSVLVQSDKVRFMVNGKEVYSGNAADLDTQGVVGYRVNHNLDVHIGPLGIHRM